MQELKSERKQKRYFHGKGDYLRYPKLEEFRSPRAIETHILHGWMPTEPFIGPETNIVAFGSCFAANVGRYLTGLGFDVVTQKEGKAHVQKINDGLVNVYAICQQFEWAWENRVPEVDLWHGWQAEDFGYDDEVRLETKKIFDEADVFILTFGLSEVWYDEPTGEVFWRAVPEDKFDPSRHKSRVLTFDETKRKLSDIYELIRKYNPTAKIVFTLSPVGLAATFRKVSAISANSTSKAILRAAIDELHREKRETDPEFFYFPSYEVVTHGLRGPYYGDGRHPANHAIVANMKSFEYYFCKTGMSAEDYEDAMRSVLSDDDDYFSLSEEEIRPLALARRAAWLNENKPALSVDKDLKRKERLAEKERLRAEKAALRQQRIAEREARLAAKSAAE